MLLRAVLVSEAVVPPPLLMSVPDLRATFPSRLDHGSIGLRHPSQRAVLAAAALTRGFRLAAGRASLSRDHGGFAIGLEHFSARLMEKSNLHEATLFPRDITRLSR